MASPQHMKPLALTMGEPAGIGPELIARMWHTHKKLGIAPFLYVGAPDAIRMVSPDTPID